MKSLKNSLERTSSIKQKITQKSPAAKKGEKFIDKPISYTSSSPLLNAVATIQSQERYLEVQDGYISSVEKKFQFKEEEKKTIQPFSNFEADSLTLMLQKENKLAKSSMILPTKRPIREKEREREDKGTERIQRERKFMSNGPEIKKQAVFPVITLNFGHEYKNSIDKSQSNLIQMNAVRTLKELKSGRNLLSFGDYGLDSRTSNNLSKDNMMEFLASINSGGSKNMYDIHENQVRPRQEKRAKAIPRTLEPLGKCIIVLPNELETGKNDLKTKKSIRHTGFRKREEEEIAYNEVSPFNSNIIKELFGVKQEKLDKTDSWKLPRVCREEKEKVAPLGMVSVKNLTGPEKEGHNISQTFEKLLNFKDLFRKEEPVLKHSRSEIKTGEKFFKDIKNPLIPEIGEIKTPVSLENTPKGSANILKSLSSPINPKGVLKNMLG